MNRNEENQTQTDEIDHIDNYSAERELNGQVNLAYLK
jgi:hypothetical protein